VQNQKAFILGMHNLASLKAGSVVKSIDCSGVKRALDLGGGPGTYSIEMANQGIDVTLFDLHETIKIARTVIE
jgi:2-polyprenyl-3-methyl-5-hydroxy-6-metoxy-1,4-benzoquinol methylase